MTITALPTPAPSTTDPTNFATRADALIAALPTFITETNATAAAMNLNSTSDTSTTSNAIGTGAKTFTVTAGKSFQLGMYLVIADTAAPSTNSMFGQITSYSGTSLVINILTVRGSGTKTAWTISQASAGGAAAGANHDITSLDDIVIVGGSVPVTINSTTSSGTKIEMQDAGVTVGFLGGTTSLPFAVLSSASVELLHVDTLGNLVPKLPLSVASGGSGSSTGVIPTGTRMIFQQTAAPTGWTKDVSASMNNASIRLTTGTVGLGGSVPFSTFAAQTIGATTLTSAQIPSHTHGVTDTGHTHVEMGGQAGTGGGSNVVAVDPGANANTTSSTASATTGISITNTGDGGSHTHALNMDLVYVDFIVATKD